MRKKGRGGGAPLTLQDIKSASAVMGAIQNTMRDSKKMRRLRWLVETMIRDVTVLMVALMTT